MKMPLRNGGDRMKSTIVPATMNWSPRLLSRRLRSRRRRWTSTILRRMEREVEAVAAAEKKEDRRIHQHRHWIRSEEILSLVVHKLGWALMPLNFQPLPPQRLWKVPNAFSDFVSLAFIFYLFSPLQKKYVHFGLRCFLRKQFQKTSCISLLGFGLV